MRKKILYLIPRFTTGGAEKLVLEYVRALPQAGFEVAVASVRGDGEFLSEFQKTGAAIFLGNQNYLRTLWRLRRFIRSWQPDIIHTHIYSADLMGYLLKALLPKIRTTPPLPSPNHRSPAGSRPRRDRGGSERSAHPLYWISTQHNTVEIYGPWRRTVARRMLQSADRVIAVSEQVKKSFRAGSWAVVANGIPLAPWLNVPSDTIFSTEKVRLAMIGRLERQKGHDILFHALTRIPELPWQLAIYGAGREETPLRELAKKLRIAERVSWHGQVHDLPRQLAAIDVVVAPSRFEGMSLTVMEAMAAERVVVASAPAARDVVEDKKTGLVVPSQDVFALAAAIEYVGTHRSEARVLAERAREFARKNFSLDNHMHCLITLYEKFFTPNS